MATMDMNLGLVLHGPKDMRLEHVPISDVGENEVEVAIASVGICGSDIKYWLHGKCGRYVVKEPMTMGHESSGMITKVGPGVKGIKIGDRVAIEPGVPCRMCQLCKTGKYNVCPSVRFCATPPIHGNLSRRYVHAADFCHKIPDHVTMDEAAMLEPLSVAVYSCERGSVTLGSRVVIFGAGPVGLLCHLVAKVNGAIQTTIIDIDESRLLFAEKLGVDHVIRANNYDVTELTKIILATTGCRPDVSLECSGADSSLNCALQVTESGGSVIMVGRGSLEPKVSVNVLCREIDIKGIFRYANSYPKALSLVSSGRIDLRPLITHHFCLEESIRAFETAISRDEMAIKVMIHCDQNAHIGLSEGKAEHPSTA
ncbi:sorbitol dehydrogenase-like [Lineus longissimus]|uniref:sorbitol dehydrogenase-like n=1 Tax=Lineus longissimus TaxID=88925 RepID=UPI002B4F7B53